MSGIACAHCSGRVRTAYSNESIPPREYLARNHKGNESRRRTGYCLNSNETAPLAEGTVSYKSQCNSEKCFRRTWCWRGCTVGEAVSRARLGAARPTTAFGLNYQSQLMKGVVGSVAPSHKVGSKLEQCLRCAVSGSKSAIGNSRATAL